MNALKVDMNHPRARYITQGAARISGGSSKVGTGRPAQLLDTGRIRKAILGEACSLTRPAASVLAHREVNETGFHWQRPDVSARVTAIVIDAGARAHA